MGGDASNQFELGQGHYNRKYCVLGVCKKLPSIGGILAVFFGGAQVMFVFTGDRLLDFGLTHPVTALA